MSPIELMVDLEVGLATVPFGVVARISVSYEYRERVSYSRSGREVFRRNDRRHM